MLDRVIFACTGTSEERVLTLSVSNEGSITIRVGDLERGAGVRISREKEADFAAELVKLLGQR